MGERDATLKLERTEFPILEFDPARSAVIEPTKNHPPIDIPENCVICFFKEVVEWIVGKENVQEIAQFKSEMGIHPVYRLEKDGRRLAFFHAGIGAPLAAGMLEEAIAMGAKKFIVCGGAGVLNQDICVGHLLIPTAAVRDEGLSYHYIPPSREIEADRKGVDAILKVLEKYACPYLLGKTWTTDAFYRETIDKVKLRKAEGCLCVEMECAALLAVARFRQVILAQLLYGGDDVSGASWDGRSWNERKEIRKNLFWLAAEACWEL